MNEIKIYRYSFHEDEIYKEMKPDLILEPELSRKAGKLFMKTHLRL